MNQATVPTDHLAPAVLRIARYAAVLLLAILTTLTVQSFFASTQAPATDAPQVVRSMQTPLCPFPNAHFQFAISSATRTPASTCTNQPMLSV